VQPLLRKYRLPLQILLGLKVWPFVRGGGSREDEDDR
jgi:hypothetical protein